MSSFRASLPIFLNFAAIALVFGAALIPGDIVKFVPPSSYLKAGTFEPPEANTDHDMQAFMEAWYGNQLRAMEEPSLFRPKDIEGFDWRVRVLVLPSFDPGFAIRVEKPIDGAVTSITTVLDGAGGYDPGEIDARMHRTLSEAQISDIELVLRNVDGLPRPPEFYGLDGTSVFIELAHPKSYVTFDLHNPEDQGALAPLLGVIARTSFYNSGFQTYAEGS